MFIFINILIKMESDERIICRMIKSIILSFANLDYLIEYFHGELIQLIYNDCHDTEKMVLTCSFKELINGLKDPDTLEIVLELFLQRYNLIFKNLFSEQNKSNLCIGFISNVIEQMNKEQNFAANSNFILEEQPFSIQSKKDYMLGIFLD